MNIIQTMATNDCGLVYETTKKDVQMEPQSYVRKPFGVKAEQITEDNMASIAEWCGGEVLSEDGKFYIKVNVHKPLNERQTMGFVGDWVLYAGRGYKVYTDRAFTRSFVKEGGRPDGRDSNVFDTQPAVEVKHENAPKPGPHLNTLTTKHESFHSHGSVGLNNS